ncbi:DUF4344 domain-containing metallopeptidase [Pseudomonas cavernae]|uniref:DUF4344 domain-containing metallopeptidase n=1 Tax=Pseudomonas cavernae TaxID=2320867 RepID=UPI001EE5934D|nr:DUF4344 domain-containing metallopeptidase [Pseudomonas cavernae]
MYPLLLLLLLSTPLAAEPPPPSSLPPGVSRFIVTNSEFSVMHEMGHMLIAELDLPVLGREEDAADQIGFMSLYLLYAGLPANELDARLLDIIDFWRLEWQRPKPVAEQVPAWDSHPLDEQRYYNIACLVYGSNPDRLAWVPAVTGLPMGRALYCDQEFEQVRKAVAWIRDQHRRAAIQGRPQIQVIYETPPGGFPDAELLIAQLRANDTLEILARRIGELFAPPRALILRMTGCGMPDAWYSLEARELTFCYERLRHFRELGETLPRLQQPATAVQCSAPPDEGGLTAPAC